MNWLVRMAIRLYQVFLSPVLSGLGGQCRFYPSCSQYAQLCFNQLPVHQALWKTVGRVLRCHPWHPGGIDLPTITNHKDVRYDPR